MTVWSLCSSRPMRSMFIVLPRYEWVASGDVETMPGSLVFDSACSRIIERSRLLRGRNRWGRSWIRWRNRLCPAARAEAGRNRHRELRRCEREVDRTVGAALVFPFDQEIRLLRGRFEARL